MCPHSGFRSGGTCERTLVPVFVPGEHPPKPPFWKTTLLSTLRTWVMLAEFDMLMCFVQFFIIFGHVAEKTFERLGS